jgi:hypothetical protein
MHEIARKKEGTPSGATIPRAPHSSYALKKPKLLTQQASPMLAERKHENRSRVFDLDQTALLTNFSIWRERF